MADKSFIEFRLDPDNIKEELSQLIPYYETLKYYHENPDAPISETAKVALNETPFIGSLLRGEPVDAAKEAIIMGMPIPTTKGKNYIVRDPYGPTVERYKFIKDEVNNPSNTTRYIEPNGTIYEELKTDPSKVIDVDWPNSKPIDKSKPDVELYDLDHNTYKDILNEYDFILDNLTPSKLKKVRRYNNAGEDITVGNDVYKPAQFYAHYSDLRSNLKKLNNKSSLSTSDQLKLKQIQTEMKLMEIADGFTKNGPYLNYTTVTDWNGQPTKILNDKKVLEEILNDNSQPYVYEPTFSYTSSNPLWVKKMRQRVKESKYK